MVTKLYAGVDVGAATAKTVVFSEGKILGYKVIPTGHSVPLAANEVTKLALENAGIEINGGDFKDIFDHIISTGYGRNGVPFSNKAITEIMCHAKGAFFLLPKTRTIIDIGGQDSKTIGLEEDGNVSNFVMNDKCAAGTGRFLEVMAEVLGVELENLGEEAMKSKNPCTVSTTCTIFAESEMVSLRAEGRKREDLVSGIVRSVASRVSIMGRTVGFKDDVVFTGGVAKNVGVKEALKQETGKNIVVPSEPQIMGALGAAIFAFEARN
ncbi:MAG: acyl-CoA dehydratase activase [Thermodesulfobacteriota bacterium]